AREGDVLANDAPEHALQARERFIEIDFLWQQYLLAAERQQLLRQPGGPLTRFLDLRQIRPARIAFERVRQQQLRVAEDRREQVVEVVGDAAGQAADALDLFRLQKALFDMTAFCDVAGDAQMPLGLNARAVAALDEARPVRRGRDAVLALCLAK